MRKADSVGPVEHQDILVRTEVAIIEWITEAQWGKTLEKRWACIRSEFKLRFVIHMQDGALVVVRLRAELDPAFVIAEINRFVLRRIDVGCPEQADVSVRKRMLVR